MTDLDNLKAAQAAAFAAWNACPASKKAEKARLEAALSCAARAVTAAKKAAEPVIDLGAVTASAVAAQAARQAESALRLSVRRALQAKSMANDWPRCGQNWPITDAEERHQVVIDNNPAIVAEMEN